MSFESLSPVNNMSTWTVNLCSNPPILTHSSIIVLTKDNHLLIVKRQGIWKYHVDDHAWNKLITYPPNFRFSKHMNVIYDEQTNCLYIFYVKELWQIDLNCKDKKFSKLYDFSHDLSVLIQKILYPPLMFKHKNEIHIVAKGRRQQHSQFHLIFDKTRNISEYEYYSTNYTLSKDGVMMKQRNSFVTIGRNNVDFCVFEYSFSMNKWTNWKIQQFPQIEGPIVGTETEDYLFCVNRHLKDIYVIDVNQRKCRKSAIRLPKTLACLDGFVISSNHSNDILLVFGYMNDIWKCKIYSNVPLFPEYLIRLISNFLYFESLQVIGRNWYSDEANYLTINIDEIVNYLS